MADSLLIGIVIAWALSAVLIVVLGIIDISANPNGRP